MNRVGGARNTDDPRLRVLHMAHIRWFNAEVQYALDLACEMRRRGHAVSFLGTTGSLGVQRARQAGLATYEEHGFNAKGVAAVQAISAALRLRALLKRRRYHALVVHRSEGLPLVALAGRAAGVPLVRVRGDMRPVRRDPFNRALYRHLLAGVVASNRTIEASLAERVGGLPVLRTIHGGVDPKQFSPEGETTDVRGLLGFAPDSFLVGLVGRIDGVKGQREFLHAARLLAPGCGHARFVLLDKGTEPGGDLLRAEVSADPVLRERVGFLWHRPDLPAVLRAFDLGVVASLGSEANCRVGLEWMASGVPLLATRVGVLPDLVQPHATGELVPPGDAAALAAAIARLAGDREHTQRLGAAARDRVLAQFTLAHCAHAHETLIRELLVVREPCRVHTNK